MTQYLRTNYRITGDKLDTVFAAGHTSTIAACAAVWIAGGSNATAGAANPVGEISITHGLGTTPAFVVLAPFAADTLAAINRQARVYGIGATTFSVLTVSAGIQGSAVTSYMTTAVSSSITMTFVWAAFG